MQVWVGADFRLLLWCGCSGFRLAVVFDLVGSGLWWLVCLAVSVSCGVDIIQFCGLLEFGVWGGAVVVSWWARVLRGFLGGWFLGCGYVGLVWVTVFAAMFSGFWLVWVVLVLCGLCLCFAGFLVVAFLGCGWWFGYVSWFGVMIWWRMAWIQVVCSWFAFWRFGWSF